MEYKKRLLEGLETLRKASPAPQDFDPIIKEAQAADERQAFLMLQTLREVLSEDGTAPLVVSTPKGNVEIKTLKEAERLKSEF